MNFKFLYLPILIIVFACTKNSERDQIIDTLDHKLSHGESRDTDLVKNTPAISETKVDTLRGKCNFDKYLSDPKVPQIAKDIFNNKNYSLGDEKVLSLLDSLNANEKEARPFYFRVVTNTNKKSDGAYAEGLGYAGKDYVENNTKEFLNNFTNGCGFNDNDLNVWAEIVVLEINLIAENEDQAVLEKTIKTLERNCADCSKEENEVLTKFITQLRLIWDHSSEN